MDEQAKAVQEVAKTTSKVVEVAEKAGRFFGKIIAQPIEDTIGVYWGDPIRAKRYERQIDLAIRVEEKLNKAGTLNYRKVDIGVVVPLLEAATLEAREPLKDMWANLLASAADPSSALIEKEHVRTLDMLSPTAAVLFQYVFKNRETTSEENILHPREGFTLESVTRITKFDYVKLKGVSYTERDVHTLIGVGLVEPTYHELKPDHDTAGAMLGTTSREIYISKGTEEFTITKYGSAFGSATMGYNND